MTVFKIAMERSILFPVAVFAPYAIVFARKER